MKHSLLGWSIERPNIHSRCYSMTDTMYVSHSWKGTIGYVKVRYEGGESGKMGQSLREREGIRKELWYVDDQSVYESRLRIRTKGQSQEKQKEFRETGDSGSFTGPGRFSCRL